MMALHRLQNAYWQVGVLPQTGGSLAYARVRYNGVWLDVMRPTDEANYGNSSACSSFIMLPWANRIRGGQFTFEGQSYQLNSLADDGTARHGDVRKRQWEIDEASNQYLHLVFDASAHHQLNYPFAFSAHAEYALDEETFTLRVTLKNEDTRRMPGGFGHHPYFVRGRGDNAPLLHLPCHRQFALGDDSMPTAAAHEIAPEVDFRTLRPLPETQKLDHLLTERMPDDPIRIIYPAWRFGVEMRCDRLFKHLIVYTPDESSVAIEPMTIATDGFNLMAQGIEGHGAFVLQPGESQNAAIHLRVVPYEA